MTQITTSKYGVVSIIPFQPIAPMGERLEHLTDIMQSIDGSEARVPLRSKPRLTYTYDFPAKLFDTPALENMIYKSIRKKFAVPVWQQVARIDLAGVITGSTFGLDVLKLVDDKKVDSFDYIPEGLALIYARNNLGKYVWEVVTVSGINIVDNTVLLTGEVAGNFTGQHVHLMPLRIGFVLDNVTRKSKGISSLYSISFEIIDNPPIFASAPAQYKGLDLYTEVGLQTSGGGIQRDTFAEVDRVDLDLGPVFNRTQWTHSRTSFTYRQVFENADEVKAWKTRFQRHSGKAREFWQPSFDINIRIKSIGVGGTTADIHSDDYGLYGMTHKHLAFRMMDGSTVVREVTGASAIDGTTTRITFNTPLAGIQLTSIYVVSYLSIYRLDGDSLEINWIGGNKAEMAIRMVEIAPDL